MIHGILFGLFIFGGLFWFHRLIVRKLALEPMVEEQLPAQQFAREQEEEFQRWDAAMRGGIEY